MSVNPPPSIDQHQHPPQSRGSKGIQASNCRRREEMNPRPAPRGSTCSYTPFPLPFLLLPQTGLATSWAITHLPKVRVDNTEYAVCKKHTRRIATWNERTRLANNEVHASAP